jgi:hypothetical protein
LEATIRSTDAVAVADPADDPADLERARAEYAAWENRTFDLGHYSADRQALIASPAAADLTKRLKDAGDPTAFTFERSHAVPGGAARTYRAVTPSAAYDVTFTYSPGGTIIGINFTRVVTGLAPR